MDQVRVALAWIKRYHFWLLCGVVTLVATGSWYSASSELSESFKRNSAAINAEFSSSGQVRSKPYHPNEVINNAQRQQNIQLAADVGELWSSLYQRQKQEALIWPKQLGPRVVQRLTQTEFGGDVSLDDRKRYQNYIQDYFPSLPKIVNALEDTRSTGGAGRRPRRPSGGGFGDLGEFGGEGGGGFRSTPRRRNSQGRGDDEEEQDYLVVWEDQERIRAELEMFETPSDLRVWVTQEDLWVYETLLKAIAAVNKEAGSDRYSNAAVRDIVALEVGQLAAKASGSSTDRIYRPESNDALGDLSFGLDGGDEFGGAGDFESGGEFGEDGDEESQLLAGRYIDGEGAPMPVTPGDYLFGTEFKRLPIRLELKIDQRWLPQLITELSNAPLQVEVNELRINVETSGRGGAGRPTRSSRTSRSGPGEVSGFSREPTLGDVILRGVVYIYNPVDEEVLAVEDDAA